jgi:hypothetical protein
MRPLNLSMRAFDISIEDNILTYFYQPEINFCMRHTNYINLPMGSEIIRLTFLTYLS